jgi:hypothetical protein
MVSPAPGAVRENATIRMCMEQECLVIEGKGTMLPRTVGFAGSFNGATGYLDCAGDGRARAVELLEKKA